ncbi:Protein NRT1/ PTR FAMILY 5.6, partial [Linum perenne]
VLVSEFSERLSYYGIASSFIIYLTTVIQQDVKTAARNVNYWSGVTTLTPLLGGFLADSYLGRYYTVFISSVLYLIGLILLTMTWFLPSLKPCGGGSTSVCREPKKIHEVTFFIAMYLISVATGGHKPALESFGADQFDDDNKEERMKKTSFFNWWNCALCCGLFLGVTVIVYIQDHVSWGAADVILAVAMGLSLAVFIIGRPFYRYRVPKGSPLTPMLHVIVAAIRNRNLPHISSPALLYELPRSEMSRTRQLCHTDNIKFLDKAAIATEKPSPWKLTTVTRVEELKLLINMLPIWLTTIPFGLNIAQGSTFYIKQSTLLDRSIGDNIVIPPSSIFTLSVIGMITTISLYEKVLVPILRKSTNNEQGITTLQRIGIGIFLSIASMVVAALVERFAMVGLQEYFYEQVPDSMRSLGISFYLSVIGAGNFVSSGLITVVDRITKRSNDGKSWFGKDLNSSRLDNFYWLIAAITMVNLVVYVFLARRYDYKKVQQTNVTEMSGEDVDNLA